MMCYFGSGLPPPCDGESHHLLGAEYRHLAFHPQLAQFIVQHHQLGLPVHAKNNIFIFRAVRQ
jgi:hypothetical protein